MGIRILPREVRGVFCRPFTSRIIDVFIFNATPRIQPVIMECYVCQRKVSEPIYRQHLDDTHCFVKCDLESKPHAFFCGAECSLVWYDVQLSDTFTNNEQEKK